MSTFEHINPNTMHHNPGFTQVITVTGPHKTVYIGGQNAIDAEGNVVGGQDMGQQAQQVFKNIGTCLEAAGAKPEHIVKWTIYVLQGQELHPGFIAFQEFWGERPNPPTITVVVVAGLANPDFLLEAEAVAVVPLDE